MQSAQLDQPSSLGIALMGKHSRPSSRAIPFGAFIGAAFALIGAALKVPAPAIVLVAVVMMVLSVTLVPRLQR
jgi:hypothetical protein